MTIYLQQGTHTNCMQACHASLADVLAGVKKFDITPENYQDIKAREAWYMISGHFSAEDQQHVIRNNQTMLARDILPIDMDEINQDITSPEDLFERLEKLLAPIEWYMYPTVKNGLKVYDEDQQRTVDYGMRYRLVIPLADELNQANYMLTVRAINSVLVEQHILAGVDDTNKTWSQVFGLPLDPDAVLHHPGDLYTVTAEKLAEWSKAINQTSQQTRLARLEKASHGTQIDPAYLARIEAGQRIGIFTQLVEIKKGIPEGYRNKMLFTFASGMLNTYAKMYGKVDADIDGTYKLLLALNSNFCDPPLPDSEVATILRSAFKRLTGGMQ